MKHFFLLLLCAFNLLVFAQQEETSTYYLIRHAEKDRTDATNKDPVLTTAGEARAVRWAQVFKEVPLEAVYSTSYQRTLQTAQPTAQLKELEILTYDPRNLDLDEFYSDTAGQHVLIVGHSNTTPQLANKLLGEKQYEQIADNNNGNLYIITVTNKKASGVLLHIE